MSLKIVAMLLQSKQILFISWDFHARYYALSIAAGRALKYVGLNLGLKYTPKKCFFENCFFSIL